MAYIPVTRKEIQEINIEIVRGMFLKGITNMLSKGSTRSDAFLIGWASNMNAGFKMLRDVNRII
jgi:hypothetical protein